MDLKMFEFKYGVNKIGLGCKVEKNGDGPSSQRNKKVESSLASD
jgi:hypothetical protein